MITERQQKNKMAKSKEVVELFERLAEKVGMPLSANFIRGQGYDKEYLYLDYNSIYGGYRIEIVLKSTARQDFDGMDRKSKNEMIAYLNGFLKGISYQK